VSELGPLLIFKRALTSDEVVWVYNLNKHRSTAELLEKFPDDIRTEGSFQPGDRMVRAAREIEGGAIVCRMPDWA